MGLSLCGFVSLCFFGQFVKLRVVDFFDCLMGIVSLLIKPVAGYYCIKGAPHVTQLAYPDEPAAGGTGTLP